ncbi:MAG: CbiX/SirB N-terminal domain-containing protein [Pseudomonadota bacterium]
MKSLLLVAHGSRRTESNDEVRQLARDLEAKVDGEYGQVACAFLELAEPSIPDGLRAMIRAGAYEVIVLPYFLSAGRHVATDIPAEVNIIRAESPGVEITLAPYLGASSGVVDLLLGLAEETPAPCS